MILKGMVLIYALITVYAIGYSKGQESLKKEANTKISQALKLGEN